MVIGYINMNYGDDLFFDILFKRYKQVDFYFYPPSVLLKKYKNIYSKYKNVKFYDNEDEYIRIRKDITDENIPINLFPSILQRAKQVDFYINIGGSIFIQNQNWKRDDRYEIKNILGNKPSFIVGCNFGPGDKEYINYLKKWFKNFDDVCFRDKYSYDMFKKVKSVRYADDIVLSYKKSYKGRKKRSVAVSLISVNKEYEDGYLNFHAQLIRKFININYSINIYVFCYNDNDYNISLKLLDKLTDDEIKSINIIKYNGDIDYFYKHFSKNSYLIGSRFHSIIMGILNRQKILPISYGDKTSNYLKDMGYNFDRFFVKNLKNVNASLEDFKIINHDDNTTGAFDKIDEYLKRRNK